MSQEARCARGSLTASAAFAISGRDAALLACPRRRRPVWEVMAHRILGAAMLAGIILWVRGRLPTVWRALKSPAVARDLAISTFLIAGNWTCFVWAVLAGKTLEASLGYYMCPLVSVAIGTIVLKEQLSRAQIVAIGLAAVGVLALLVGLRMLPWVSLFLATSFAVYGYIRKRVQVEALDGLFFVETAASVPPALAVLYFSHPTHTGTEWALLLFAGPVTLVPLLFYTESARRSRLSTLGILQYIAPSVQLDCGLGVQ
ncbi:MAG: EamA family transporter RarD [Alphaproteobacteria bacterium]